MAKSKGTFSSEAYNNESTINIFATANISAASHLYIYTVLTSQIYITTTSYIYIYRDILYIYIYIYIYIYRALQLGLQ